jgi:hypothetical protein
VRRKHERNIGAARRARERDFAIAPEQPRRAYRRDADRALIDAAEESDLVVAMRDVHQRARGELDGLEHRAVGGQGDLVFGAAFQVLADELRQAPARHQTQVLDVQRTRDAQSAAF